MFRLFAAPIIVGILTFLVTWFISPLIVSEAGIVSIVSETTVYLSNSFFETMPPVIAAYLAGLNLVMVAVTVALLVTVMIQLLVMIWYLFSHTKMWIITCLQKYRKKEEPQDLPPIDMDPSYKTSSIGQGVYGRGLDGIDRD